MWVYPPTNVAVLMRKMRINQVSSHFSSFFCCGHGSKMLCTSSISGWIPQAAPGTAAGCESLSPPLAAGGQQWMPGRSGTAGTAHDPPAGDLGICTQWGPGGDERCSMWIASLDGGMCNGNQLQTWGHCKKGDIVCNCVYMSLACLWQNIYKISHVLEMFHGLVMWKRYFFNNLLVRWSKTWASCPPARVTCWMRWNNTCSDPKTQMSATSMAGGPSILLQPTGTRSVFDCWLKQGPIEKLLTKYAGQRHCTWHVWPAIPRWSVCCWNLGLRQILWRKRMVQLPCTGWRKLPGARKAARKSCGFCWKQKLRPAKPAEMVPPRFTW